MQIFSEFFTKAAKIPAAFLTVSRSEKRVPSAGGNSNRPVGRRKSERRRRRALFDDPVELVDRASQFGVGDGVVLQLVREVLFVGVEIDHAVA